jgi:hypothetical protein
MSQLWDEVCQSGIAKMGRASSSFQDKTSIFVVTKTGNHYEIFSEMSDIHERMEIGSIQIERVHHSKAKDADVHFAKLAEIFFGELRWQHLKVLQSGLVYRCGIEITHAPGGFVAFVPADMPYGVTTISNLVPCFGRPEYKFEDYVR